MESFSWKSHPAKERPLAAAVVAALLAAIFYFVYLIADNPIMLLVAALIFLFSLSSFFFPTTYIIDRKNVVVKHIFNEKSRNITAFRTIYPGQRGVLLSPYLTPTRIENFRGFYLRYGKNNKAEVDEFLTMMIEWLNEARGMSEKVESENDA